MRNKLLILCALVIVGAAWADESFSINVARTTTLPTAAQLAANLAKDKAQTAGCCSNPKYMVDGNLNSAVTFDSATDNYISVDLGAMVNMNKVQIVANNLASQYVGVNFQIYVSNDFTYCTRRESVDWDASLLIKEISFSNMTEVISLSLTGVTARFLVIGTGSMFNQKVRPPQWSLNELIVNGALADPSPYQTQFLSLTDLPSQYSWWTKQQAVNQAMRAENYIDTVPKTVDLIFPVQYQQACLQSVLNICYSILGQYGKGKYVFNTGDTLFKKLLQMKNYPKSAAALYSFFGVETYVINNFNASTMDKVVFLNAESAITDVPTILQALSNGQSFMFSKDAVFKQAKPWFTSLIDALGGGRNVVNNNDYFYAWESAELSLDYLPLQILKDSYQNPALMAILPLNPELTWWASLTSFWQSPEFKREISLAAGKSLNRLLKYHCACSKNPVVRSSPQSNLMRIVRSLLYSTKQSYLTRPLSCSTDFPVAPSHFAQRDTVIVTITSVWAGRFVNSGVAVGAQVPFGYRIISGDPTKFSYTIGCNRDNLMWLDSVIRWPEVSRSSTAFWATNYLDISQFAGILYVTPSESSGAKLVIEFYGVYEMAVFSRKAINENLFKSSASRTSVSFLHLEGNILDVCPEWYLIRDNSYNQIIDSLAVYDSWVTLDHNFVGTNRSTEVGELWNLDRQLVAGSGHAGYPWSSYQDWAWWDPVGLKKLGSWGVCHEIGHNRVQDAFQLPGNGEVTNNVLCWANYNVTLSLTGFTYGGRFFNMDSVVRLWKVGNYEANCDYSCKITYFGYLATQFGIKFWSNFFHLMMADTRSWFSMYDKYVVVMSEMTQYNWSPYHSLWGWNLQNSTLQATSKYKCFMPDDSYSAQVKQNISSILDSYRLGYCYGRPYLVRDRWSITAQINDVFRPKDNAHSFYSNAF